MKAKAINRQIVVVLVVLLLIAGVFVAIWTINSQRSSIGYNDTVTLDVDHLTYESVESLKKDAPYIFIGTVQGEGKARLENARPEDELTDPSPFTDYIVAVEEVIKGKISDKNIIFSQLGGVNDRTLYAVENYPTLSDRQRNIFFAVQGDGKYGALAGGYAVAPVINGKFTLKEQVGIKLSQPLDLTTIK